MRFLPSIPARQLIAGSFMAVLLMVGLSVSPVRQRLQGIVCQGGDCGPASASSRTPDGTCSDDPNDPDDYFGITGLCPGPGEPTDCNAGQCPVCGDSMVNRTAEVCDGEGSCDAGSVCADDCSACIPQECGDGITQPELGEECDDGNAVSGDGCDNICKNEFCGDGIFQENLEECEDHNTESGDGCSATCNLETSSSKSSASSKSTSSQSSGSSKSGSSSSASSGSSKSNSSGSSQSSNSSASSQSNSSNSSGSSNSNSSGSSQSNSSGSSGSSTSNSSASSQSDSSGSSGSSQSSASSGSSKSASSGSSESSESSDSSVSSLSSSASSEQVFRAEESSASSQEYFFCCNNDQCGTLGACDAGSPLFRLYEDDLDPSAANRCPAVISQYCRRLTVTSTIADKCAACDTCGDPLQPGTCTRDTCESLGASDTPGDSNTCVFRGANKFFPCVSNPLRCENPSGVAALMRTRPDLAGSQGNLYCCAGPARCVQAMEPWLDNCDPRFAVFQPGPGVNWGTSCPSAICNQFWVVTSSASASSFAMSSAPSIGGLATGEECDSGGAAFCANKGQACAPIDTMPFIRCL